MTESLLDTVHIHFDTDTLWVINSVLGLVMFGVALEISIQDFNQLWSSPKAVLVGLGSQCIALPAITYLLVVCVEPMASIALGMFMVAACPGGTISNFIAHLSKANTALSVSLTAISTLLAILCTPLNFHFWSMLYVPSSKLIEHISIAPIEMFKLVSLLLGIPLVVGMAIRHVRPKLALKLAKMLKTVSLVFFIVLIGIALYQNRAVFMEYIGYVFWMVVIHNGIAFTTGYGLSSIFQLPKADRRSITIETGIQNSGLALLLIFTFFDGLGGMALVAAFWGIWHIVSGLLLASFWNARPIPKVYGT